MDIQTPPAAGRREEMSDALTDISRGDYWVGEPTETNRETKRSKKMVEQKKILWHKDDTPIPKIGWVLQNLFHERWKVIERVKKDENYELTLRREN